VDMLDDRMIAGDSEIKNTLRQNLKEIDDRNGDVHHWLQDCHDLIIRPIVVVFEIAASHVKIRCDNIARSSHTSEDNDDKDVVK